MTTEFARPFRLDHLGDAEVQQRIVAEEGERAALAARFELIAIESLIADYRLRRDAIGIVAAGTLHASVVQACIASAEPVPATIDEDFTVRFLPDGTVGGGEIELSDDAMDTMFYTGQSIDLGEAAAETLALSLDPYPRAPDAEQVLREAGVLREEEAKPFSALAGLKDVLKGG